MSQRNKHNLSSCDYYYKMAVFMALDPYAILWNLYLAVNPLLSGSAITPPFSVNDRLIQVRLHPFQK